MSNIEQILREPTELPENWREVVRDELKRAIDRDATEYVSMLESLIESEDQRAEDLYLLGRLEKTEGLDESDRWAARALTNLFYSEYKSKAWGVVYILRLAIRAQANGSGKESPVAVTHNALMALGFDADDLSRLRAEAAITC